MQFSTSSNITFESFLLNVYLFTRAETKDYRIFDMFKSKNATEITKADLVQMLLNLPAQAAITDCIVNCQGEEILAQLNAPVTL